MPRKLRKASESGYYHFISRGINKQNLFYQEKDYRHYLALLKECADQLDTQIYHYCLMTNHTHILLRCNDFQSLSKFGHQLQRKYAYYYCRTQDKNEQVFRRPFVSVPIENDSYLLECGRYIERNPVRAKLAKRAEDYPYSSFHFYRSGKKDSLLTPNPLYFDMGRCLSQRIKNYSNYVTLER